MQSIARRMAFELDRLRAGAFTAEELQSLCHSGLGLDSDKFEAFCDGCTEYQRKLFGRSREDEILNYRSSREEEIRRDNWTEYH